MGHHKNSDGPDLDTVYTCGLGDLAGPRIDFSKAGSFAIVLYNTMPSHAMVRVVKPHKLIRRQTFFSARPTQVTKVTHTYSSGQVQPTFGLFASEVSARCSGDQRKKKLPKSSRSSRVRSSAHEILDLFYEPLACQFLQWMHVHALHLEAFWKNSHHFYVPLQFW